jgi:hypothetical protein
VYVVGGSDGGSLGGSDGGSVDGSDGGSVDGSDGGSDVQIGAQASVECYDPVANEWRTLPSMSAARCYCAAAVGEMGHG